MIPAVANPVVHLELHTDNLSRACAFYTRLFRWRAEAMRVGGGSYLLLDLLDGIDAGVVEREVERPTWVPYVEVEDVTLATALARGLGASVVLEPREGPAGWRGVLGAPSGAEVALWQPKT